MAGINFIQDLELVMLTAVTAAGFRHSAGVLAFPSRGQHRKT